MENLIPSIGEFAHNTVTSMTLLGGTLLVYACLVLILLIVFFFRIYIAYRMAKNRHRDPLGWALFSFFVSPILTWIILLIVGDANNN